MVGPQGSSFIPKQPATGKVKRAGVRRIYIFTYVAFVMFFGTIIAAAGTFFYQVSVDSQLEAEKQKLIEQKEAFSQADISRVEALSLQIAAARMLLDNHISAASLFETLENNTVSTIQLTSFSLSRNDFSDIEMTASAKTSGFNPALFQREVIRQNPVLAGAVLESVNGQSSVDNTDPLSQLLPEELQVTFNLRKELKPSEVPYQPITQRLPVNRNVNTVQTNTNNDTSTTEVDEELVVDEQVEANNQVTQ